MYIYDLKRNNSYSYEYNKNNIKDYNSIYNHKKYNNDCKIKQNYFNTKNYYSNHNYKDCFEDGMNRNKNENNQKKNNNNDNNKNSDYEYNFKDFYPHFGDSNEEEYYEKLALNDKNRYGYMYELPDINQRLIILDTEVTGRNRKDFNILEVCAFEMINGKLTGKRFHSFFKPKDFMTSQKIKKNNVPKEAFLYTSKNEVDSFLLMRIFIEDSIIIAHKAEFDLDIINKALENYNIEKINPNQFRCSMRLFLKYYPEHSRKFSSLNECCGYLGIKFIKEGLHLASYDAFLAGKIMEKIYERTQNQNSIHPNNNFISNNDKSKENKNDNDSFTIFKEHEDEVEGKENSNVNNDNNINKIIGNISDIKEEKKKDIKDNELNILIDNNIEDLNAEKEEQESFENFINENIDKIVLEMSKKENNNASERDSIGEFINENLNVISFLLKNNNNAEYLGKKRK